jgi:hypothetical protein
VRVAALALFAGGVLFSRYFVEDVGAAELMPYLVTLTFVQLAPAIFSSNRDLFSPPVYVGLVGAFSTVASAAYYAQFGTGEAGVSGGGPAETVALLQRCVFALGLGAVAYQVGYYLKPRPGLASKFPDVAGLEWNWSRLIWISGGVFLVAALAYAAFQLQLGVPLTELTRLAEGKQVLGADKTSTWMVRGIQFAFLPPLLLLTHLLRHERRLHRFIIPAVLTAIAVALVFRTSLRGTVAQVLICVFVLFHYLRRRMSVALFLALYFVGVSFANVAVGWRTQVSGDDVNLSLETFLVSPSETLARHDADRVRFTSLAIVMDYFPDHHDYLYGESWLAFLTVPIPRWIWPEKREFTKWQDNAIATTIAGIPAPPSLPGVLYANFSWIGIALGMFFIGIFHRGLYDWLQRAPRDPSVVLLYVTILLYFSPTMLGFSAALQYVLPLWLIIKVIGRRAPVAQGFGASGLV